MQTADTILMIRPAVFGFNRETVYDNFFQQRLQLSAEQIHQKALEEFDNMVTVLSNHGINVIVAEDSSEPPSPDALFPNNWICTNPDGIISVFPLYAHNRRKEKREDIPDWLNKHYIVRDLHDWSEFETEGLFLEGTGSMVMDHENRIIYAALSERTHLSLLEKFAATHEYAAMAFHATDRNGRPVYHTNVLMSVGETIALLCEEAITDELELIAVTQLLQSTDHFIIPITQEQMHCYAGNMLELRNNNDDHFLVMSQVAYNSLTNEQFEQLQAFTIPLPIDVTTIEAIGGGSVRCMMAEIFLARKEGLTP